MGWDINFNIVLPRNGERWKKSYPENITLLHSNQLKSFHDNLLEARQSKVLLDFVINAHHGLSFRAFEALGHDKKLITTNGDIIDYDFYHPNNIFILNENNIDELPDFLAKPFYNIEQKIKEKYSFGNWIKYVLDIEPHQAIILPKK
ncbi:hypothetical protein SAMN05660772_01528 [Pasteurella testudinis DSM 23072]|uniref:Uncharacterized protein n=2 Tax=Pasteurella testudinis TaxID=761 RepID=A0A1W1VBQ0_9PAST|nr:hypothetical protein SAMN05660772_01528 [Pasteurella testudinis DSM 23072]SUB52804.1 Uncharacterised protein [Pasteurella testudinis]